ncbi:hypothetical protein [Paenibacillus ehimensis]|uniref:Uncharacterized protein n=1 Tax=Paenibacillus ehimensis TaxID=79264 RepID=A0ABT8VEW1_9BACL|nr:hypothetical protein [Paenibacillus ehimensis]MDO3679520.1 hypothetical protein [Paenibacillus ehimensis]
MGNRLNKIIGTVFLLASGAYYTAERIGAKIAAAIPAAGSAARGSYDATPTNPTFFENFFVWFFMLVGFVLLTFGFPKDRDG